MPSLSHLTSWTLTTSNLYLAISLAAALSEHALCRLLTFQVPNLISLRILRDASPRDTPHGDPSGGVVYLRIVLSPEEASCLQVFLNMYVLQGGLLAPRPTPKMEDHPLSSVHDCLFNLFTATLHIGGRSSIRSLITHSIKIYRGDWQT